MHERGAVRARADAHAPSLRQPIGDLAGVGIAYVDGDDAAALPGAAAEDLHAVDIGHAIQETRDQPFDMRLHIRHPALRKPAAPRRKTRQAMRIGRSGLERLGHEARMALVEAMHARTAFHQRGDIKARAHAQPAGALRPVEAFMSGEAHDVGADA